MSHITKEQLQHIAKLCRIQMDDADIEHLLPQLENIIDFVGKLQECDVAGIEPYTSVQDDVKMVCRFGVVDYKDTAALVANTQHTVVNNAIQIANKLKQVS